MKITKMLSVLMLTLLSVMFASSSYALDGSFNITKGQVNALHNNVANNSPANSGIVAILLKAAEADATLEDYDDAAALLGAAGNDEADFTDGVTPYARKVLTDVDISATTVDDTNNIQWADLPDLVWTDAGGTTNNTLVKLVLFYDPDTTAGTDADLLPLTHADFATTTTGTNLTAAFGATGYYSANN